MQLFCGVTPQYLCSIESGKNCLSVEKIILLSKKANITTDYILLGKTNVIDNNILKSISEIQDDELDGYFNTIKHIIKVLKQNN